GGMNRDVEQDRADSAGGTDQARSSGGIDHEDVVVGECEVDHAAPVVADLVLPPPVRWVELDDEPDRRCRPERGVSRRVRRRRAPSPGAEGPGREGGLLVATAEG